MSLHPWAEGPFELILHGELHYRAGDDFDRRMALISFDNSIEVSIATYLSLKPLFRRGVDYDGADVKRWLGNYHTKLDFFEFECTRRGVAVSIDRIHIAWYHTLRNEQYHEGKPAAPNRRDLDRLRSAAFRVFSILYEVDDVECVLDERITAMRTDVKPGRDEVIDQAIDNTYGLIAFGDSLYLPSELLHSHDPVAYQELGLELLRNDAQLRSA